jgi:hypothetical protein
MNKSIIFSLLSAAVFSNQAATVFTDNFSSFSPIGVTGGGVLWSYAPPQVQTAPLGEKFLGQFDNTTASLLLGNLPAHTSLTVSFDLYTIQSWDGDISPGPDTFTFSVDGVDYLNDTFRIFPNGSQSYPVQGSPGLTGADGINTLGFPLWGDAVYELTFTIPHANLGALLEFAGSNLQGVGDEGWGIDNIEVEVNSEQGSPVPEVQTYATMAGAALIGLQALRRRVRK